MSLVVLFVVAVLIVAAIGIWLVLATDSVEADEQVSNAWRDDLFRNRREDKRED
jgi:hypothetical protein